MATKRKSPKTLLAERKAQIERAYDFRVNRRMSERARLELEAEYARQLDLARKEYNRGMAARRRAKSIPASTYKKKKVSHAKKLGGVSDFWPYFAPDGTPIAPWDVSVGPGMDVEELTVDDDLKLWAEQEYDYEDFDADWGSYEHDDTGYPDENS